MNRYTKLEKQIGIRFKDKNLLDNAFVHSSYVNEHKGEKRAHNERLEFLGDAVLELVTTEFLYQTFPDLPEGKLTSFRSALVKGRHLAEVANGLDIGFYLYLSHGEEKSGGRRKNYILANAVEALIGAIYLDRGFKTAHKFVSKFIIKKLGLIVEKGLHVDAKSRFQELAQGKVRMTPAYRLLKQSGPDHNKIFVMGAYIGDELVAKGSGNSKQEAEQAAAAEALKAKGWE